MRFIQPEVGKRIMALGRRNRTPRPRQFGITLSEERANLLRAEAERLKLKPTTLAAQLLEQALNERSGAPDLVRRTLDELRGEVHQLARAHFNATLKLLRTAGGMSVAEVGDWAKRHLGSDQS